MVAVVGVVGSGKSSLMSALLGDMMKVSGTAAVSVSVKSTYQICPCAHNWAGGIHSCDFLHRGIRLKWYISFDIQAMWYPCYLLNVTIFFLHWFHMGPQVYLCMPLRLSSPFLLPLFTYNFSVTGYKE